MRAGGRKKREKKHTPRQWLRSGGVHSRDGPRQRLRLTAVTGTDQDRRSSKEIGKVLQTYYEGIDKTGFSYNSRLRDNSKQQEVSSKQPAQVITNVEPTERTRELLIIEPLVRRVCIDTY